jgi:phage shock protein E
MKALCFSFALTLASLTAQTEVKHLDAPAAQKALTAAVAKPETTITILDVRTPEEFQAGHVAGAVNVDFNGKDFAAELAKLPKEKPYLVHCRSGGRSGKSLEVFQKLGFKSVLHLDGGILAWEAAKLPVVKPEAKK